MTILVEMHQSGVFRGRRRSAAVVAVAVLVVAAGRSGSRLPAAAHARQPAADRGRGRFPPGVYGKTGTAQYGNGPNPPPHGWFIGYRGDLAFAVLVEGVASAPTAPARSPTPSCANCDRNLPSTKTGMALFRPHQPLRSVMITNRLM